MTKTVDFRRKNYKRPAIILGVALVLVIIGLGLGLVGMVRQNIDLNDSKNTTIRQLSSKLDGVKISQPAPDANPGVHVNITAMTIKVTKNRAQFVVNDKINALKQFLTDSGNKDIQLGCTSTWYNVQAWTSDDTQVRLGYGCTEPTAAIFAVYKNNTWSFISPTNHFDSFNIPQCDYVDQNGISTAIAPVCFTTTTSGAEQYVVR